MALAVRIARTRGSPRVPAGRSRAGGANEHASRPHRHGHRLSVTSTWRVAQRPGARGGSEPESQSVRARDDERPAPAVCSRPGRRFPYRARRHAQPEGRRRREAPRRVRCRRGFPGCCLDKPTWRYLTSRAAQLYLPIPIGFSNTCQQARKRQGMLMERFAHPRQPREEAAVGRTRARSFLSRACFSARHVAGCGGDDGGWCGPVSIECDGAARSRAGQAIRELTDMNRDVAAFSMSRTVAPKVRTDVA
jgi:hypothetical protein